MAEIRIEGKDAVGMLDAGHLYLVYRDDNGNEFVIRGGPEDDGLTTLLSPIAVEVNVPIDLSEDRRADGNGNIVTPEERGSIVLDLNGRDAESVWQEMLVHAQAIDDAEIDYDGFGPNSNSTVSSVLDSVGINVMDNIPIIEGIDGTWFTEPWPGIGDIEEINGVLQANPEGNFIDRGDFFIPEEGETGTNSDTYDHELDVDTNFSHGNTQQETSTEEEVAADVQSGNVYNTGNASVNSSTANEGGTWSIVNASITEGYQLRWAA